MSDFTEPSKSESSASAYFNQAGDAFKQGNLELAEDSKMSLKMLGRVMALFVVCGGSFFGSRAWGQIAPADKAPRFAQEGEARPENERGERNGGSGSTNGKKDDDLFAEASTPEAMKTSTEVHRTQTRVPIDSAGALFKLAMRAAAESGGTSERMSGRSWLVHPNVILLGHPAGESKGDHSFVALFGEFRSLRAWPDDRLGAFGHQGEAVTVVAKLFWRDPYYVSERQESVQTDKRSGDLVPGAFEIEVLEVLETPLAPQERNAPAQVGEP